MSEFNPSEKRALYSQWEPYWEMYADFVEFGPDILFSGKYLHVHPREEPADYVSRVKRSDNYNLIPEILAIYSSYQFAQMPKRTYTGTYAKELEAFALNCDGKGTTLNTFMQESAYADCLTYGWTELLVDMPVVGEAPLTKQQEEDSGIAPYVRSITPLDRVNWGVDANGAYNWIDLKEKMSDSVLPSAPEDKKPTYLVLTPTGWQRWKNNKGKLSIESQGEHKLGRVPIIPLYYTKSRKFMRFGVSMFQEAAPNSQAILNLVSQQAEDIFASFSFLAVQTDKGMDDIANVLGTKRLVTYSADSTNPPSYIVVPVEHIKVKQEVIEAKIEHMLKAANLSAAVGEISGQAKSGIAGEVERRELFQTLREEARKMETAEQGVMSLVASWKAGKYVAPEETGFTVQYNDEFRLESTEELIFLTEKVQSIYKAISPTYVKSTLKMLPHSQLREGDEQLETINAEIEAANVAEMDLIPEPEDKSEGDEE